MPEYVRAAGRWAVADKHAGTLVEWCDDEQHARDKSTVWENGREEVRALRDAERARTASESSQRPITLDEPERPAEATTRAPATSQEPLL